MNVVPLPIMMRCSACGAEARAACGCGAPYVHMRAGKLAAKAIAANPGLSNRAIADKHGVSFETVRRARKTTDTNVSVEPRVGKDGKVRRSPKKKKKARIKNWWKDITEADIEAIDPGPSNNPLDEDYGSEDPENFRTAFLVRHIFYYNVWIDPTDKTAKPRLGKASAKVFSATKPIEMILTADHVTKSIKAKGVGDTLRCSVAFCVRDHADKFPHAIDGGMIDFQYTTAFVASKHNKSGWPTECYVYQHSLGEFAKLNDSRGGQRKLLKLIEQHGPIHIVLRPARKRKEPPVGGHGGAVRGLRAKIDYSGRGASRRAAYALAGGVPWDQVNKIRGLAQSAATGPGAPA